MKGLYLVQQLSSEIKLYDYISQQPSKSDLVRDHQKNLNPNNSSDWGKTSIRIGCDDQTWGSAGHLTFIWECLGYLSWLGDAMAEVEVDTGDLAGQWWMILHTHMQGQGWKEVSHPSMGFGWLAQIGTSLSTKGPRGSGVI